MQEAFSLLAYADPWNSPVGNQLEPAGREPVCAALNSAILGIHLLSMLPLTDNFVPESKNLPGRPPLEISLAHSAHLLKLMSHRYQFSTTKSSLDEQFDKYGRRGFERLYLRMVPYIAKTGPYANVLMESHNAHNSSPKGRPQK